MSFVKLQTFFFIFSSIFLVVIAPKVMRSYILLCVSIVFILLIDIKLLIVLLIITLINYYFGFVLCTFKTKKVTLPIFIVSLSINISYFLSIKGFFPVPFLIKLPDYGQITTLGLSFYTFKSLSFLADCFKKQLIKISLVDYLNYIFYFPQFTSGPIERFGPFAKSIGKIELSDSLFFKGLTRISVGLFKKLVIADRISPYVNTYYLNPDMYNWSTCIIAITMFSFQIYFDFSGYSDIAIGVGLLLGIKAPENFQSPYLAPSIRDFWRRWHITLSSFFRDYVYIPLGGNRTSILKKNINVLVTFLMTGLWHGLTIPFFVWGLVHGLAICLQNSIQLNSKRKSISNSFFSVLLTFMFVTLSWIFFKSADLSQSLIIFKSLFLPSVGSSIDLQQLIIPIIALVVFLPVELNLLKKLSSRPIYKYVYGLFLILFFLLFSSRVSQDFLYFKF